MNRLLIAIAFLLGFNLSVLAEEGSVDEKSALKYSEDVGLLLFNAVTNGAPIEAQLVEAAKSKITEFCDFQYQSTQISIAGQPTLFFLAKSPIEGSIVFGRHYKVAGATVTPSTVSCFATQPGPPGAAGAFITHLLSPYPTEFHAFLSLLHKTPIFVGTSKGVWQVDNGKISLVQAR
ncbi:hypothetical protein [Viridibacterium curvum]|uniref:Uncharacterized protein n=1 Tax=Viridibacterium curvum TaxID=1101404 RepID=A0ABP9R0J6_9RHOO